ncbi:hypothetical protein D3C76_910740 [compost metagenome]|jgi:hypothetical protein|uniref:hypothetical protein n=1 Tax=Pseudomonas TaxID=286 RepID=UPI00070CFE91|nr:MULTISPECIES: hypothetical protein [Pseudomonas]OOQ44921.1 hypothetical protein AO361_17695 [Pseudomonas fluorescens]
MIQLQDYFRSRVSQAAYDLFAVFSRFEYAMKKGGFRRRDSADAAWTKFANDLPADIFPRLRAAPEVAIYFDAPPDRLVADTGEGVQWSGTPTTPSTLRELLDCIKIARNNLFHGDKRHDNRRDTELMAAALFVLNHIYESIEHEPKFDAFISEMEYGL